MPETSTAPQPGYQPASINTRAIVWIIVVFIITGVLIEAALWFFAGFLDRRTAPSNLFANAEPVPVQAPPLQPSLQHPQLPVQDWAALRQKWEDQLAHYGPPDSSGFARIPIQRAMALALDRGILKPPATMPAVSPQFQSHKTEDP